MLKKNDSIWDTVNCERLRHWWEDNGFTHGRIADEFALLGYAVTRNMVAGKIHRMKLQAPEWKAEKLKRRSAEIVSCGNIRRSIELKRRRVAPQIIINGKKYNPNRPMEAIVSSEQKPDGKKSVLLIHSKEGQCKAIVGYIDGKAANAVYCGEDTVTIINSRGREVETSWCGYHRKIYTTEAKK